MSPARTNDELDFNALVRRILLDITLLRWFATTGGRSVAVISAIAVARRESSIGDVPVLDFLERYLSPTQ